MLPVTRMKHMFRRQTRFDLHKTKQIGTATNHVYPLLHGIRGIEKKNAKTFAPSQMIVLLRKITTIFTLFRIHRPDTWIFAVNLTPNIVRWGVNGRNTVGQRKQLRHKTGIVLYVRLYTYIYI